MYADSCLINDVLFIQQIDENEHLKPAKQHQHLRNKV